MAAFANPFDPDKLLWNGCPCGMHRNMIEHQMAMAGKADGRFVCEADDESAAGAPQPMGGSGRDGARAPALGGDACIDPACADPDCIRPHHKEGAYQRWIADREAGKPADPTRDAVEPDGADLETALVRTAESAVMRGLFGTDMHRRAFLRAVGASAAYAAIGSIIPLDKVKAAIVDAKGPLEKSKLNVGFVPITCATPIIMAHPLGFYKKYPCTR